MKKLIIKNQKQWNKIPKKFSGIIEVIGEIEEIKHNFNNAIINVYGSAVIESVFGSAVIKSVSDSAVIESVSGSAVIEYVYGSAVIKSVSGSAVIRSVYGSAVIRSVSDSAVIKYVYGSAVIESVFGSAVIKSVSDSAVIKYVYGSAVIEYVSGSAVIKSVFGSAVIRSVYDSAVIKSVSDSAVIRSVYDSAVIESVSGSAVIEYVSGSAVIKSVFGSVSVLSVEDYASVTTYGYNIVRYYKHEKNIKIKVSKNTTVIVLSKKKITFNEYIKHYPVKVIKTKGIFYKAVRKRNDMYYSDYNSDFQYKIGKIVKEKCDNNLETECSYGIHIAPLYWCKNYGRGWGNLAILEVETNIKDMTVPCNTDGKVRTSRIKVLREITI